MNATSVLPETQFRRSTGQPTVYIASSLPNRPRVAVFGSFMGGYYVLHELRHGPLAESVDVVGVATDDPTQPYTNPQRRLWKYAHSRDDELMVQQLAKGEGLPVFTGRVRDERFIRMVRQKWRPDLCLMATFGQRIPPELFTLPPLGFYNFHHSGDTWPSYPGPDPIADMLRDRRSHLVLTMHEVIDRIDGGAFVGRSHAVPIPPGITAIEMHRISWPQMRPFIRREVGKLLGLTVAAT